MNLAEQSRLSGFPEPRAFQVRALDRLREGLRAGHRCQMLVAPTGAGKTFIGMYLLSQALSKGKRGMFVCDRRTLIEQTSATADRYGLLDHGVIMASHHRFRPHAPLQIASVQTLARRSWPEADVIIIDEAHTQLRAWTEHIPHVQSAVVGLSATPYSDGLGRLFSNVVNAATMRELTELGVLVPMRVLSCTRADMRGAETSGGEWTDRAAEERGMEIVGDVIAEWLKYAEGRKTIVFAATINHCRELERQFRQHGVAAATFTSETSAAERESLLRDYRGPDAPLRVLISVEALAKGFDVPDVGCVVDCRPLRKSLSTAIQMWGRGLRSSPDTGKADCVLLDHSGNIVRFRNDFEDIYHNGLSELDDGKKLDRKVREDDEEEKDTPSKCPACGYTPFVKRCMACGHELPPKPVEAEASGGMMEIFIGKARAADNPQHLYAQCVSYARMHSAPEKQRGRAAHIYRDITGAWPPRMWGFDDVPETPVSRAVLNKIKQKNIAFAKARA